MVNEIKNPIPLGKYLKENINLSKLSEKGYFPNWLEFSAQYYQQILRSLLTVPVGGNQIIYTVPANRIFFLTGISMGGTFRGLGGGRLIIQTQTTGASGSRLLTLEVPGNSATTDAGANIVKNFNMPIKINSGTIIYLSDSGGGLLNISATIDGFLAPYTP